MKDLQPTKKPCNKAGSHCPARRIQGQPEGCSVTINTSTSRCKNVSKGTKGDLTERANAPCQTPRRCWNSHVPNNERNISSSSHVRSPSRPCINYQTSPTLNVSYKRAPTATSTPKGSTGLRGKAHPIVVSDVNSLMWPHVNGCTDETCQYKRPGAAVEGLRPVVRTSSSSSSCRWDIEWPEDMVKPSRAEVLTDLQWPLGTRNVAGCDKNNKCSPCCLKYIRPCCTAREGRGSTNQQEESCDKKRCKPVACLQQRFILTVLELRREKERRNKAEQAVERVRQAIEDNRAAVNDMIASKKMALEMAQRLRDKYMSVKESRDNSLEEANALKLENCSLCLRLKSEANERKRLSDDMGRASASMEATGQKLEEVVRERSVIEEEVQQLQAKLLNTERSMRQREEEYQEQLEKRSSENNPDIQKIVQRSVSVVQDELDRKTSAEQKLQSEYKELERRLVQAEKSGDKKFEEMEDEFRSVQKTMKEKEGLMRREREELRSFVKELADTVTSQKARIKEQLSSSNESYSALKAHQAAASKSGEDLMLAKKEMELLKKRNEDLEQQVKLLKESLKGLDNMLELSQSQEATKQSFQGKQRSLEERVEAARYALEAEKDKVLIKDKIIDDQNESIRMLKKGVQDKTEKLRGLTRQREEAVRDLVLEQKENEVLVTELENVRWNRTQLQEEVIYMESELQRERSTESDMSYYETQFRVLETQMQEKEKDWEFRMEMLLQEKHTAMDTANFATSKLMETVSEFQKQVMTQRHVQGVLTEAVTQRERQLMVAKEHLLILSQKQDGMFPVPSNATSCPVQHNPKGYDLFLDPVGPELDWREESVLAPSEH